MSITLVDQLKQMVLESIQHEYSLPVQIQQIQVSSTKPEFEGDYSVVLFSFTKAVGQNPEQIGQTLGAHITQQYSQYIKSYNVIKGFLNLVIQPNYWIQFVQQQHQNKQFGTHTQQRGKVVLEYSSPNTNKPLHLGHLRNIFLGWSVAEILKNYGHDVVKTCVVNDRGIHICKSMIAWQLFGEHKTPQDAGLKGDHFVGYYYVKFNDAYKQQISELVAQGLTQQQAEKEAPIMVQAQQMLLKWEQGDEEVLRLWKTMNEWVYSGFEQTYNLIGADFQHIYYESNTYLLGKDLVQQGLQQQVFQQKEDGSVWIDLKADGLDEKLVQRRDGTSVYITQDIGLAVEKQKQYNPTASIYVVGDEQNYHFKVLQLICKKLGLAGADGIYHLSYGMVELPTGKMKSREGTVVDADDMVQEMLDIAQQKTNELGKVAEFSVAELQDLYKKVGIGALKFFLVKVDPKKKMIFNPEESIDFHGYTAPFIQYTFARIKSILRKNAYPAEVDFTHYTLHDADKQLIHLLEQFPNITQEAALLYSPAVIAMYMFNLAKCFNSLYAELPIANAATETEKSFRMYLIHLTQIVIEKGMHLLGIGVPERM